MPMFALESGDPLDVTVDELIVAGWSGRDDGAIREHIAELEALGVTPPSATPLFYRVGANLITTADTVQVVGEATSGEAEVLLVGTASGTFVGIASDHTDREAEAWSVAHSKQVCPKPMGRTLWPLDTVIGHWDELRLEAHATIAGERVRYQQGAVSGLLAPADLLALLGHGETALPAGVALLCGTLPVIGGPRPAERFEMSLIDPVRERRIDHAYAISMLPIVA